MCARRQNGRALLGVLGEVEGQDVVLIFVAPLVFQGTCLSLHGLCWQPGTAVGCATAGWGSRSILTRGRAVTRQKRLFVYSCRPPSLSHEILPWAGLVTGNRSNRVHNHTEIGNLTETAPLV